MCNRCARNQDQISKEILKQMYTHSSVQIHVSFFKSVFFLRYFLISIFIVLRITPAAFFVCKNLCKFFQKSSLHCECFNFQSFWLKPFHVQNAHTIPSNLIRKTVRNNNMFVLMLDKEKTNYLESNKQTNKQKRWYTKIPSCISRNILCPRT